MQRDLVHDKAAEDDLVDIYLYSLNNYGEQRADLYLQTLEGRIKRLSERPEQGRDRSTLREGYWSIRVERHVVFYIFDDAHVRIRRVLHERMDFGRHISSE